MKITVITPTFNSGSVIATTMQSVLAQTHDSVEHIIVDGLSSDNTLAEVERFRPEYEKRGYTLRVVSERDSGLYDAMNKGVKLATADVIGILNSDDFYKHPEVLAEIAEAFERDASLDAVYGDIDYVNGSDLNRVVRRYCSAPFRRRLMLCGFQPPHPSVYCRKRVYDSVGLYDTRYRNAADFDFLLRAIYRKKIKMQYIPDTMVTMRTGGTSDRNLTAHIRGLWEHQLAYVRCRVPSCIILDAAQLAYKLIQVKLK